MSDEYEYIVLLLRSARQILIIELLTNVNDICRNFTISLAKYRENWKFISCLFALDNAQKWTVNIRVILTAWYFSSFYAMPSSSHSPPPPPPVPHSSLSFYDMFTVRFMFWHCSTILNFDDFSVKTKFFIFMIIKKERKSTSQCWKSDFLFNLSTLWHSKYTQYYHLNPLYK